MSEPTRRNVALGPLGSLRSELDDTPELDPSFQSLEICFQAARLAYMEGRLSAPDVASLLQELRLTGSDGAEWTLGATSTRWYRRTTGGRWQAWAAPIGLNATTDPLPDWVRAGIMDRIQLLTAPPVASTPSTTTPAPESAPRPTPDVITSPVSPQRKSHSTSSREDADWLLAEWEASPAPLSGVGAPAQVGTLGLPEQVPASWQPETGLNELIGSPDVSVPAERDLGRTLDALDDDGRDVDADAYTPGQRSRLPEDFFLSPDDKTN